MSAKFELERERLLDKQQVEMDHLLQKCHALTVAGGRARTEAFAVLRQKYTNLDKDVSHAFHMEFKAPPACEVLHTAGARARAGAPRAAPRALSRRLPCARLLTARSAPPTRAQ